jgi:predicted nucleic acid-binding protein
MSFTSAEFCDTNVLLYAHDEASPTKRDVARQLIARAVRDGTAVASVQVLQELFVGLTRKGPALPHAEARTLMVGVAQSWRIYEPTAADVLTAVDNSAAWQVSFWDAMLLTAANQAGAATLWTEDLSHGQTYGAVTVRNPFRR